MQEINTTPTEESVRPHPINATVPGTAHLVFSRGTRPAKGKRAPEPRPDTCLNCGRAPLDSAFCPDCGQENVSHAVPLGVLLADIFEEFVKWDGRLMRTLGALLRPGLLTQEYGAGRRARYLSPFKMYFVVTALFVFLISQVPLPSMDERDEETVSLPTLVAASRKSALLGAAPPKAQHRDLSRFNFGENENGPVAFGLPVFGPNPTWHGKPIRRGDYLRAYDDLQTKAKHKDRPMRHAVVRQVMKLLDDPPHLLDELRGSIGKAMFFLLPVYALLLAGLFRGARRYYLDHLIFAVHQHTVGFIVLSLITAVGVFAPHYEGWVWLLVPGFWAYEFFALRRVYKQGKRLTLFKQWFIGGLYSFCLMLGLLLTILVQVALL